MPEIVENLTVARFLCGLGVLIYPCGFRLDFSNQYAIIIMNFLNDDVNFLRRLHVYPFHRIGPKQRVFFVTSIFSQTSIFPLPVFTYEYFKAKQPIMFVNFSSAKIACVSWVNGL